MGTEHEYLRRCIMLEQALLDLIQAYEEERACGQSYDVRSRGTIALRLAKGAVRAQGWKDEHE